MVTHEERQKMRELWAAFFRDYDVLLCPVSPAPAIRHDNERPPSERTLEISGRERSTLDQFGWMGPFGVLHLPASVAPAGRTRGGLPVGVQVVGPTSRTAPLSTSPAGSRSNTAVSRPRRDTRRSWDADGAKVR